MVAMYLRIVTSILLISAGAIHTFPPLWMRWDQFLLEQPEFHWVIGGIAFTFGILNLIVILFQWYKS